MDVVCISQKDHFHLQQFFSFPKYFKKKKGVEVQISFSFKTKSSEVIFRNVPSKICVRDLIFLLRELQLLSLGPEMEWRRVRLRKKGNEKWKKGEEKLFECPPKTVERNYFVCGYFEPELTLELADTKEKMSFSGIKKHHTIYNLKKLVITKLLKDRNLDPHYLTVWCSNDPLVPLDDGKSLVELSEELDEDQFLGYDLKVPPMLEYNSEREEKAPNGHVLDPIQEYSEIKKRNPDILNGSDLLKKQKEHWEERQFQERKERNDFEKEREQNYKQVKFEAESESHVSILSLDFLTKGENAIFFTIIIVIIGILVLLYKKINDL